MTVLAANFEAGKQFTGSDIAVAPKQRASTLIFDGAMTTVLPAEGYVKPAVAEVGAFFTGIARKKSDNSTGADGAINCELDTEGVFKLPGAGFAQTDNGKEVFLTDDNTVALAGTGSVSVGLIVDVISATLVLVKITAYRP